MKIKSESIELVDINTPVPYEKNMHVHTEEQIDRLIKLIEYQGFRNPLVLQRGTNRIAAGHGRLVAAKKMGMEKVPVIYQEFESEEQFYAYVVSDNAIGKDTWAQLDLSQINKDIIDLGPDLDLDMLGLKDFVVVPIEKFEPQSDEDAVPEVKGDPVTKRGDVWLLGNHRVMCGDSTMIDDVEKLMNGEKADMVFTDPPYNQNTQKGGGKGALADSLRKQSDDISWICDFDPDAFLQTMPNVFNNEVNSYIFCNKDLLPEYLLKARELGASFWVLIWKKESAIPINSAHHPDTEYLVVMRKSSVFNSGVKGVSYSRLLQYNRDRSGLHPTMKPVELIENQLRIGSNTKSIVVDFFGGSGSTFIACEKTNRKCYGMELDEHYCDVIIQRWQDYTGKKATLESNGKTYEELKDVSTT